MKTSHLLVATAAALVPFLASAADKKADAKPYPLDKCLVSDEKFEGSDMKPHEFVHEGQTIKLCCKSCLKDFEKDKAGHLKKLSEEVAKTKKAK
jgi:FAD synthase